MKTDRSARRKLMISIIVDSLALAAVVGSELWVGASWAARLGHTTASQTQEQLVPNVGIHYLITEVR
jgi:hypothetical protein